MPSTLGYRRLVSHALFRDDLRGTLRALDEAAQELLGYGPDGPATPMALADVRAVLRRVYKDVGRRWQVSQPAASKVLGELERQGYVTEVDRREPDDAGRPVTHYVLTGAGRLVFDGMHSPGRTRRAN